MLNNSLEYRQAYPIEPSDEQYLFILKNKNFESYFIAITVFEIYRMFGWKKTLEFLIKTLPTEVSITKVSTIGDVYKFLNSFTYFNDKKDICFLLIEQAIIGIPTNIPATFYLAIRRKFRYLIDYIEALEVDDYPNE